MTALSLGGVILCGGESRRMGMPKAELPFGSELLIERIVRLLQEVDVVEQVVVVKAADQQLPSLPASVLVTEDRRPGQGPLEGLVVGLQALAGKVDAAYVTSCDAPLLVGEVVKRMWGLLQENDIVVPTEEGRYHPLAAIYRVSVEQAAGELLAEDQRRPAFLFDRVMTHKVPVDDLKEVDPELRTFQNVNEPNDYFHLLQDAGYDVPAEIAARLKLGQAP
jgi:molybdopterin-guanine dinucleotide biosynthesis protein A